LKKEQQNKVCIISLGCPKNLVDSEVMGGLLRKAGYQLVQDHDHADIAIVNTCAFINPAKEESIEEILRLAEAKKKNNPQMRIMVAGCLAQRHGQELFHNFRRSICLWAPEKLAILSIISKNFI